jgi:predicted nuclease of restriction endonuclease-like (RecB) superfamily
VISRWIKSFGGVSFGIMVSVKHENAEEQLYSAISKTIDQYRDNAYRAVNSEMVKAYWEIGRLIVEQEQAGAQRAKYGGKLVKRLSDRLTASYGKGFESRNLMYMRQFYLAFPIVNAVRSQLSWTHYRIILKIRDKVPRNFYAEEAISCNWSSRQLERQINSSYYERMLLSGKKGQPAVRLAASQVDNRHQSTNIIKDPYVLEFLDLKTNHKFYEKDLEQALIDKLQEFLLELGKGFSFVSRQGRISAEEDHFYVDLVFYNFLLKCFLLVDLKTGKLTHQDIGQMDFYVRYFEDQVRPKNDNPTIGLILCAEKNQALAKYSLLNDSKQVFASKYKLYLPTEEELQRELQKERDILESGNTR